MSLKDKRGTCLQQLNGCMLFAFCCLRAAATLAAALMPGGNFTSLSGCKARDRHPQPQWHEIFQCVWDDRVHVHICQAIRGCADCHMVLLAMQTIAAPEAPGPMALFRAWTFHCVEESLLKLKCRSRGPFVPLLLSWRKRDRKVRRPYIDVLHDCLMAFT